MSKTQAKGNMRLRVLLTEFEEPKDVVIRTPEMVRFERAYNVPAGVLADEQGQRIEYLAYMAFEALRRKGEVEGDFEAFLDLLEDIEFPEEEGSTDPSGPAAPRT